MDDISIALLFLFAIGIITLIGHGIWVLVAAIFRAIFREPDAERAAVDNGSGAPNQSGDALRGMRLAFARRRQLLPPLWAVAIERRADGGSGEDRAPAR